MDKKNQAKDNRISSEDLSEAAVLELNFERLRADDLLSSLYAIKTISNDQLARKEAKKAIDRYFMDGVEHARLIFGNK